MLNFKKNQGIHKITSIDDFSDARARSIAVNHNLNAEEIFPIYRNLEAEVQANRGTFSINPDIPQGEMIKKLICGAVISYELSTVKGLKIMDNGKIATLQRSVPAEVYSSLGRYYEGVAKQLLKL